MVSHGHAPIHTAAVAQVKAVRAQPQPLELVRGVQVPGFTAFTSEAPMIPKRAICAVVLLSVASARVVRSFSAFHHVFPCVFMH
jgi:hypothetical protein